MPKQTLSIKISGCAQTKHRFPISLNLNDMQTKKQISEEKVNKKKKVCGHFEFCVKNNKDGSCLNDLKKMRYQYNRQKKQDYGLPR